MKAGESQAAQAAVFERMPVLLGEREYGTVGAHTTCFAYSVATWCFLTGGYVADLVGAIQGMVCLIAGSLVGVFVTTMPLSLGCQRYGLEQIDFCKPAFGQRGAQILLVFYLFNMVGWSGLILVMFGNGLFNLAEALGYHPGGWVVGAGVALGLVLSGWIVVSGVHWLNRANAIIAPGLAILIVFMLWTLLREHGWSEIVAAAPLDPGPDPVVDYLVAFELGVASGISWWGGIGFLARNTRSRRNAVYPEILQLGLAFGLVCSVALFSALTVGSDDPTAWMVPIGGPVLGLVALAFVAFANVTTTAVSIFASGLALRHVRGLRDRAWWQLVVAASLPCLPFVFWPHEISDLGDAFLAYNGTLYAPIVGIVFVDYFVLRRERLCLWSIFDDDPGGAYHYTRGFHWPAFASLVLGQAVYLFLYDPISGETHALFRYAPASIAACVVPALTYWLAARALGVAAEAPSRRDRLVDPNV